MEKDKENNALTPEVKFKNYLRLQQLLNSCAVSKLRQMFCERWYKITGRNWMHNEDSGRDFVDGVGTTVYRTTGKIQKQCLRSGNINSWDITLLGSVIQCLGTDSNSSSKSNQHVHKNIDDLKEVRNKLSHQGTLEVSDADFQKMWNTVTDVLIGFGTPPADLEQAKNMSLEEKEPAKGSNINEANTGRAKELKELGNTAYKNENYSKAVDLYTEAIQLPLIRPVELSTLYSNRSLSHLKLKCYSEAKDDAKGAIHLRPVWFKGYFRLANAYMSLNKHQKAWKNFDIALGLDSSNVEVQNGLAHCKYLVAKQKRDEHLDPMNYAVSFEEIAEESKNRHDFEMKPAEQRMAQKLNYQLGLTEGICGEAHNYRFGRDVPQDYERAAQLYAKAARKGSAEGMYNLAQLTQEGLGVRKNAGEAIALLQQAASQDITKDFFDMKMKIPNIGVVEAEHSLGLRYANGIFVKQDYKTAIYWYERAIKHGSSASANNMAIMYSTGEGVRLNITLAIEYWKISVSLKLCRGAENLALQYIGMFDVSNFSKFYALAIKYGSVSLKLRTTEFEAVLGVGFDKGCSGSMITEYENQLYQEVRQGPLKHLIDDNLPTTVGCLQKSMERLKENQVLRQVIPEYYSPTPEYKIAMILDHRQTINELNKRKDQSAWAANPATQKPKPLIDLVGLKPILLKDMDPAKDHVYDGFVIKLTIIEDAGIGRPSIPLIAEDENGDAQRIYVYNYTQKKETQDELGFGCKISIANPYFRLTKDGKTAIRVDDSSLLFLLPHLTDKKRCRYCGKADKGTVPCRRCKRCFYCSKQCLMQDAKELKHELICKKHIV